MYAVALAMYDSHVQSVVRVRLLCTVRCAIGCAMRVRCTTLLCGSRCDRTCDVSFWKGDVWFVLSCMVVHL